MIFDRFGVIDAFNRYAYGVDLADELLLASAFTSTAVIEWSGTGRLKGGGERIAQLVIPSVKRYVGSQHMVGNVAVSINGDSATASAYAHALSVIEPPPSDAWLLLTGVYEADLVRDGDLWRFEHLVFHCSWYDGRPDAIGWMPPPHYEPEWKGYAPGSASRVGPAPATSAHLQDPL
jgi:hypothetical protein